MVPTYVFDWPTGAEKGDFLALDLGESQYFLLNITDLIILDPRRNKLASLPGHRARRRKIRGDTN